VIRTWNEREGMKLEVSQGVGYFTEYEQNKMAVPPFSPFGSMTVVFLKQPTEKSPTRP
jgi:hypothetical protein